LPCRAAVRAEPPPLLLLLLLLLLLPLLLLPLVEPEGTGETLPGRAPHGKGRRGYSPLAIRGSLSCCSESPGVLVTRLGPSVSSRAKSRRRSSHCKALPARRGGGGEGRGGGGGGDGGRRGGGEDVGGGGRGGERGECVVAIVVVVVAAAAAVTAAVVVVGGGVVDGAGAGADNDGGRSGAETICSTNSSMETTAAGRFRAGPLQSAPTHPVVTEAAAALTNVGSAVPESLCTDRIRALTASK
jgi:hypothetical protein